MFEFIEKLRQKSEKTKTRIALLTAFSFSGLIFVLWLTVFLPDFTQSQKRENQALANEPSPISTLGSTLSEGFSSLGEQLSDLKKTLTGVTNSLQNLSEPTTTAEFEAADEAVASTTIEN